mmetsp:Transcript_2780/g.7312  ORF Transcript_2780/g.7312 Transcript_2780/m.7312 type:complete len:261 (-) Transcript_2780:17-799(-)
MSSMGAGEVDTGATSPEGIMCPPITVGTPVAHWLRLMMLYWVAPVVLTGPWLRLSGHGSFFSLGALFFFFAGAAGATLPFVASAAGSCSCGTPFVEGCSLLLSLSGFTPGPSATAKVRAKLLREDPGALQQDAWPPPLFCPVRLTPDPTPTTADVRGLATPPCACRGSALARTSILSSVRVLLPASVWCLAPAACRHLSRVVLCVCVCCVRALWRNRVRSVALASLSFSFSRPSLSARLGVPSPRSLPQSEVNLLLLLCS